MMLCGERDESNRHCVEFQMHRRCQWKADGVVLFVGIDASVAVAVAVVVVGVVGDGCSTVGEIAPPSQGFWRG